MFPRLCLRDQILYATAISQSNPQGVKAVYVEFLLIILNTMSLFQQQYVLLGLEKKTDPRCFLINSYTGKQNNRVL